MQAGQAAKSGVRMVNASRLLSVAACLPAVLFLTLNRTEIRAAERLQQALRAADRTNPQLEAERARLRATDEEQVGQRNILGVLNAEQELLEAKTSRVLIARHVIVAQYTLLAAMGRLDATFLRLNTEFYEPKAHYDGAKRKALTTSIAPPQRIYDEEELTFDHAIVTGSIKHEETPSRMQLGRAVPNRARRSVGKESSAKRQPSAGRRSQISLRGLRSGSNVSIRPQNGLRQPTQPTDGPSRGKEAAISGLCRSVIEQ